MADGGRNKDLLQGMAGAMNSGFAVLTAHLNDLKVSIDSSTGSDATLDTLTDLITEDFSATFTVLATITAGSCAGISGQITALGTTITNDFTSMATQLSTNQSMVVQDFNSTWTQLSSLQAASNNCCTSLGSEITALNTLVTNDFASMATQLATNQNVVVQDFNSTWTQLGGVQTSIANLAGNVATVNTSLSTSPIPYLGGDIDNPGVYSLTQDLTLSDRININASNVVLDLNGYTIFNQGINAGPNGDASNIAIKNGFLQNATVAAIYIDVDNVTISNININGFSLGENAGAIYIDGSGGDISQVLVENVSVANSTFPAIFISLVTGGVVVNNSTFFNCAMAISGDSSSNIVINDCQITGSSAQGVVFSESSNITINGCVVQGCLSGVVFTNTSSGVCKNTVACNNSAYGFNMANTSNTAYCAFINCQALANTTAGFALNFTNNQGVAVQSLALGNGTNYLGYTTPTATYVECTCT